MATAIRNDMVYPEALTEAVRGEFEGVNALYGSGAAFVTGRGFPDARGGDTIRIPYFGTIGDFETLASDEGAGGAIPALTPSKLSMTSETATVQHGGKAVEITRWARYATQYADPYAEMARQLRLAFERYVDGLLITEAATTTLTKDVFDDTTSTGDVAGKLTWRELLEARFLWGDEQDDIALALMHPNTIFDLLMTEEEDGTGATNKALYQAAMQGQIIRAPGLNVPIKMSRRATVAAAGSSGGPTNNDRYTTLALKRNALALWFSGGEGVNLKFDEDILADTDIIATHTYLTAHLYSRMPGSTEPGVVAITHNVENAAIPV